VGIDKIKTTNLLSSSRRLLFFGTLPNRPLLLVLPLCGKIKKKRIEIKKLILFKFSSIIDRVIGIRCPCFKRLPFKNY
jgi:hypothetical protein